MPSRHVATRAFHAYAFETTPVPARLQVAIGEVGTADTGSCCIPHCGSAQVTVKILRTKRTFGKKFAENFFAFGMRCRHDEVIETVKRRNRCNQPERRGAHWPGRAPAILSTTDQI